jgi:cephalosporin hydroxylase
VDGTRVFDLGDGMSLCADTILYGYDIMFEQLRLFNEGTWLGVPNQQDPQDAMVIAELIALERPDVIVELGTNEGGGALFYASIMELVGHGEVITIDPSDFRAGGWIQNKRCEKIKCKKADESPVWKNRVTFMQGLPTSLIATVRDRTQDKTVWVIEDGSHEYSTVSENVNAYAPLVTMGGLLQIQDTKLTRMRCVGGCDHRQGPMHAMEDFMNTDMGRLRFAHDRSLEYYYYTQHAKGWLRRVA